MTSRKHLRNANLSVLYTKQHLLKEALNDTVPTNSCGRSATCAIVVVSLGLERIKCQAASLASRAQIKRHRKRSGAMLQWRSFATRTRQIRQLLPLGTCTATTLLTRPTTSSTCLALQEFTGGIQSEVPESYAISPIRLYLQQKYADQPAYRREASVDAGDIANIRYKMLRQTTRHDDDDFVSGNYLDTLEQEKILVFGAPPTACRRRYSEAS